VTAVSTASRKGSRSTYRQPSIRVSRYTSGLPKVIVLHDHEFVAEALEHLLADRIDIVAQTRSGKAAVALSELMVPDVVVVSEMLIDGVVEYFIPALLQTGTRLLLVSEPHEKARLLELVELGVTGLIDTDQAPEDLADAVLVLASGGAVLQSDVVATIATDWRRARRRDTNASYGGELTNRELEVLGAMSDGLSTKAVAHQLGIAVKTVENHKTRIFDKLGVRTQAQAVAVAIGNESGRSSGDGIGSGR
jgi:DNA-binding NarL/FixJ family response regulator